MPISQILKPALELLGTITTTSGAAQSLSGLDLTDYEFLICVFNGVSGNSPSMSIMQNGQALAAAVAESNSRWGDVVINLNNSIGSATLCAGSALSATAAAYAYNSGLSKASGVVTFSVSVGVFDAGSILVYGLRG